MNRIIPFLLALLLLAGSAAAAAGKTKAQPKYDYGDEVPAQSWSSIEFGFNKIFGDRLIEIESSVPGRFFPGVVAFVMREMSGGHFLMLSCRSASCDSWRSSLEDRLIFSSLLLSLQPEPPAPNDPRAPRKAVKKSRAAKGKKRMRSPDELFDQLTWKLTPIGEEYILVLRKRYPDLNSRIGRMVGSHFR